MEFWDVLKTTLVAFVWLSWIALLIACVPSFFVFAIASKSQRWRYVIGGLCGGLAGGFCGVATLFFGLYVFCNSHPSACDTAQADMGLIVTVPLGSVAGSLLALCWTRITLRIRADTPWASVWIYSGPRRSQNWAFAIAIPIVFWLSVTCLLVRVLQ